ncbi:MAG: hypothetical protein ACREQE_11965, partial [Candidatus Binataceae bacterium]
FFGKKRRGTSRRTIDASQHSGYVSALSLPERSPGNARGREQLAASRFFFSQPAVALWRGELKRVDWKRAASASVLK